MKPDFAPLQTHIEGLSRDSHARRVRPPLQVFIGWDTKEPVAFAVLAHSILTRASGPVSITPLVQQSLRDTRLYTRERGPLESTEFSMTRFLVPHLMGYRGIGVFLDCDILCRTDLYADVSMLLTGARSEAQWQGRQAREAHLVARDLGDPPHTIDPAVLCVQHDYEPSEQTKFLGQPQTSYPKKNWSSVMVFDAERCQALTPEYVNTATGLQLHRFAWLDDEAVGALPYAYNWLVGEYEYNPDAKLIHWTLGGPWMEGYERCDYAGEWFAERDAMLGQSVAA